MEDLAASGCTLATILKAGQWRTAAFMRYMDEAELDRQVAFELAIDSDGEEWVD